MRSIPLVIAVLFFYLYSAGQTSNEYKYFYNFQIDYPKEISVILLDSSKSKKQKAIIKGHILNRNYPTITLKSKDATITKMADQDGYFTLKVKPSTYEVSIADADSVKLTSLISVQKHKTYTYNITFAQKVNLTWYDIHSVRQLSEKEIEAIKKCVQQNENRPFKCSKKNEYYIAMEI